MVKLTHEQQIASLKQQIKDFERQKAPAYMIDDLRDQLEELEDKNMNK